MDENVKLRATIEGDSKPLQNALNQAGQAADQAAKQVGGSVNAVGGSMERAAGSANAVGETAKKAGMTIGDAMRHPIEAIKRLVSSLREAKTGMEQLGEAGKKAGNGSKDVEKAMGAIAGIGSKFAIIAKGFSIIKEAIYQNLIQPIAEAYKETQRLANVSATKAGKHDKEIDDLKEKQQALLDYWSLYQSIQDKLKTNTASAEEKEQERQARRNLERHHGVKIDPRENVENQVIEQVGLSQIEIGFALDKKIAHLEQAIRNQKRAVKEFDSPVNRGVYGINSIGFQADLDALIEKQFELEEALKKAKAAREMARIEDPAEDLYRMNRAKEGDKFREGKAKAAEEAEKSAAEEARARMEAEKAHQRAIDALDQWAADLLDDEGQKRLDAAFAKYAALIEQGVSEADAKPILDEALRQELARIVEKEAAARESMVKEYMTAKDALKTAMQREQAAQDALTKANEDLADLKKQQAKEDRLEKIDQKRARLQSKMSRFGFAIKDGSHIGESAADRRKRQRTERTDARIAAKLRRAESGRSVYFNDEEKRRLKQYKALQKQDRALDKEAKAIRAADKQLSASAALKSASDAIKTAAENLEAATAERETAQAEALEKRWNAAEALEKEAAARKRAEEGVKSRGQKWSEKPTKEIPRKQTPAQTAAPTKPAAKKQTPAQTAAPTKPAAKKQTPAQVKRTEGPKQSRPMAPQVKRAAAGVKQQVKMTAPSRGGIAGKAAKPKDYSGYLDKITRDLGEKIYVVK